MAFQGMVAFNVGMGLFKFVLLYREAIMGYNYLLSHNHFIYFIYRENRV